jgi:glycine oxidase
MNRTADVIVVGAGVIGLAVAYELSRRGARVRVLDARGAGEGASQASAGMLTPHTETSDHATLWRLGARSLDLYDGFLDCIREDSGVGVEYRRCGSLHVAATEAQTEDLRRTADRLGALNVACELLDAARVRELEPQIEDEVTGGLLVPGHGYVAVGDLVRAMSAAGGTRGVRLDVERVLRIGAQSSGVRVETQVEAIHAPAVVVAAGSWTARVVVDGDAALPVRPVRGQLVQLDWPTPPLARIVWGPDCYLVPWTTGALLVGATVEEAGFDERATTAGVRDLLESACELLPRAWQAGFSGVRVGLRPATPDGLPVIGASSRVAGVYYATGHYRNGVLLAPVTALLLADLVLGQPPDSALDAFRTDRFGV